MKRRTFVAGLGAALAAPAVSRAAPTISDNLIKLGVLTDMSGMYSDGTGPGSVLCCQLAAEEFGNKLLGFPIEVIAGDHQNKPDIGGELARRWIDTQNVDVILDCPVSSIALQVQQVAKDRNRIFLNSSAGATVLAGKACSPTAAQWTYDTYALAHAAGSALLQRGGGTWFFITADYLFGESLQHDASELVIKSGGKVLGAVKHPMGTADFSSYLLQAQSSGAKVVGLCNAGSDTVNAIKQAGEFGLTGSGIKLAALLVFISDVHALGLPVAQGLVLTESFYWDLNDRTRAFTNRVLPKTAGARPGMGQAGCYAGTLHYLKTVAQMGALEAKKSGAATVARMKQMPTEDDAFGPGQIRPDGRTLHPAFLFQVKTPAQSKGPWDYYQLLGTTPMDQAFRPLADGACPLVHG